MLLLTLRGTPTLYYGDELGMTDVAIPVAEVQDPFEKNEPGKGLGRDPQRTPMPWNEGPQAGFTRGRPWLRLGDDAAARSVAAQQRDPASMLALYRRLLELRRRHPALHAGSWDPLRVEGDLLAYARTLGDERMQVLLNFGAATIALPHGLVPAGATLLLSTAPERWGTLAPDAALLPHEGVLVRV